MTLPKSYVIKCSSRFKYPLWLGKVLKKSSTGTSMIIYGTGQNYKVQVTGKGIRSDHPRYLEHLVALPIQIVKAPMGGLEYNFLIAEFPKYVNC